MPRLAVVSLGLASPAGFTSRDHVFFLRVGLPDPAPAVFREGEDDAAVDVRWASFLGSDAPRAERVRRLASIALDEAMLGELRDVRMSAVLVGPRKLAIDERADLERVLRDRGVTSIRHESGAAGAFRALARIEDALARDGVAMILAVDSLVDIPDLIAELDDPPSPWAHARRPPSEGAAALVVSDPSWARRAGVDIVAHLEACETEHGTANDDNDDPVDGMALAWAIRKASGGRRVALVAGQHDTDGLRSTEWRIAAARNGPVFEECRSDVSMEESVGRLGAAAGLADLVLAIATLRHRALPFEGETPFLAWTISADGLRGVVVGSARSP